MVSRRSRGRIRIPLNVYNQNWKVTVNDVDVTSNLMQLTYTRRSLRYGCGRFDITLWNDKGLYNDTPFASYVKIYFEHTTGTPINQVFYGRLDALYPGLEGNNRWKIRCVGRDYPELLDKRITITIDDPLNTAIAEIIDTYFNGVFTYTNLDSSITTNVEGTYVNQKPVNIIADLLKQAEADGYIDMDRDIHTFLDDGNNRNLKEKIVYGDNMMPFDSLGRDGTQEYNEIIVQGEEREYLTLFRTKRDSTSISESWTKTKIINAKNLNTSDEVSVRAVAEIADNISLGKTGMLTAHAGLPTLHPTEYIWCSAQYADIGDWYKCTELTTTLSNTGESITHVLINKLRSNNVRRLRQQEESIISFNRNPNGMEDVLIYLKFDDEIGITVLNNLEVINGRLRLKEGEISGTCTTDIETADADVSSFEVRARYNDDCSVSTFRLTADTAENYTDNFNLIGNVEKSIDFEVSGSSVRAVITLEKDDDNPAPELERFCVSVKR